MKVKEFAKLVLKASKVPLSYKQIIDEGKKMGLYQELEESYKGNIDNIAQNIHSSLDQDINTHGDASPFIKLSGTPVLYGLAEKQSQYTEKTVENAYKKAVESEGKEDKEKDKGGDYNECDLHPVLTMYLSNDSHFNCRTRTIVQQEGEHPHPKGVDKWRYPDLIGIYDIEQTRDYAPCTLEVLQRLESNAVKVFSFEMKKAITISKVREYYFQAVSNSSWANEGYLVAAEIDEDDKDLLRELSLLNNLFGIGVIKLDIILPRKSKILFPSRVRDTIDVASLNVLINRSTTKSGDAGAVKQIFEYVSRPSYGYRHDDIFDKVFEDDEYNEKTKNGQAIKGISGRKK